MGGKMLIAMIRKKTSMFQIIRIAIVAVTIIAAGVIGATPCQAKPLVWMGPPATDDGECFRELFTHPNDWQQTRSRIDVLGYADHWLDKQFSDQELQTFLPQIDKWGLKLGLEVGA